MFDMGFIADLRFILRRLPKPEKRQSFLFSATLSFRVLELTWEFMNNPAQISITPQQKTVEKAEQVLYHVGREEKFNLLLGLLRREGGSRILIFSNTREEARRLEDRLSRNGWEARALTGDVDQKKRLKILNDFKDGQLPILVATDVASRGLHIEGVSHVVNWDLPQDAEDYVHRIGRTARAGAAGKAISLVDEAGALALEPIEKFIAQKTRRPCRGKARPDIDTPSRICGIGIGRRIYGCDDIAGCPRARRLAAAVSRSPHAGDGRDGGRDLEAAAHRRLFRGRWSANRRRGRAPRLQRHPRATAFRRPELLGRRIYGLLVAGLQRRPGRGWRMAGSDSGPES